VLQCGSCHNVDGDHHCGGSSQLLHHDAFDGSFLTHTKDAKEAAKKAKLAKLAAKAEKAKTPAANASKAADKKAKAKAESDAKKVRQEAIRRTT
jgi:hypothetical protein